MATICNIRELAYKGKREKPHYFLPSKTTRVFWRIESDIDESVRVCMSRGPKSKIRWSTWGPSR